MINVLTEKNLLSLKLSVALNKSSQTLKLTYKFMFQYMTQHSSIRKYRFLPQNNVGIIKIGSDDKVVFGCKITCPSTKRSIDSGSGSAT